MIFYTTHVVVHDPLVFTIFSALQPPRVINYLDIQTPSLLGYYGANLKRLRTVKTQYDPQNYFQNPLTIPPLEAITASGSPAFDSDQGGPEAPISAGINNASDSPAQEATVASMASYPSTLKAGIVSFLCLFVPVVYWAHNV